MRATILGVIAMGMLGCSGGGLSTDLDGTYTIATWTENTTGCAAEGPSILEQQSDTALYIEPDSIFGQDFINAVRCTDVADCMTKQADTTIFLDGWTFEAGSDSEGWTGGTVFAGVDGTMCQGEYTEHRLTGTPGAIKIESRSQMTAPFPQDKDGFCDTDAAKAAAAGMPCTKLEVVTATGVQ